jgi:hypothetical protein
MVDLVEFDERINYLLTSTSVAIYTSKNSGDYGATSVTDNVKQMASLHPDEGNLYVGLHKQCDCPS